MYRVKKETDCYTISDGKKVLCTVWDNNKVLAIQIAQLPELFQMIKNKKPLPNKPQSDK